MGLTRRKGAAGTNKGSAKELHPGGQIRRADARGGGGAASFSIPAIVLAVAVGVAMGLLHQRQGLDLADTLIDLLRGGMGGRGRSSPAPSLDTVGAASSSSSSSRTPAQGKKASGSGEGAKKKRGLVGPLAVRVHANGASEPAGELTLRPEAHRSMRDLRRAAGALAGPACAKGDCRVFTHFGYEVKSLGALTEGQQLFLVPPDRHFVWPTFGVGHRVELPGVASAYPGKPITLTTLAESPRVFEVENFFSEQDADDLVAFTLGIDDEVFGLKRSTTGAKGSEVSSQRTSENAFDTSSPVAMKLKRRVFDVLGMRPYDEELADGLQVLRYNVSKAYIPHLDYLEMNSQAANHDFDSSGEGTNRFATMLLYLNDVEEGGQTVFPHAPRPHEPLLSAPEGMALAEERGWLKGLAPNSWQHRMMGQCASRLAVQPRKARAVLFYSQHPDGKVDRESLHGACPVVRGQKWASNLWVWNGPRYGYNPRTRSEQSNRAAARGAAAGRDEDEVEGERVEVNGGSGGAHQSLDVAFSSGVPARLFWRNPTGEDVFFGELTGEGAAQRMNTYAGHEWVLKDGEGKELHAFRVVPGTTEYRYL